MPDTLYPLQDPYWFTALAVTLGLVVGSFLNVVIHRLPLMLEREWRNQCAELLQQPPLPDAPVFNLSRPGSHCPHCNHAISALENIPVLSYVFLRGRCRGCGQPISLRYPLVEIFTAALSGLAAWHFGFGLAAAGALFLTWALVALSGIDFDTQLLPDDITLPLLWLGLLLNYFFNLYTDLPSALLGAVAGYLSLWSVYQLFKLATGKEGMGYGDFKLLAMLGAWLGWQFLPLIILFSSLAGAIIGLSLMLWRGRSKDLPMPFGPYLAIAGWITLLWGEVLARDILGWHFILP